ncbi:MAG: hypothetical protein ACJAQT_001660 [Akkermansiaceae bacterium]|jgi:hypothetical protein
MSLPSELKEKLSEQLLKEKLLAPESIDKVVSQLDQNKPINWNLVLNQQLKSELPDIDAPEN